MLAAQLTGRDAYRQSDLAFACYHVGAILIAASGPLNMGSVTHLSATWFPEHERTTATAVAQTSNGLGTTVGFLNPILVAPTMARIPNVFYITAAISLVPLICMAVYLPAKPPTPPSAAEAITRQSEGRTTLQVRFKASKDGAEREADGGGGGSAGGGGGMDEPSSPLERAVKTGCFGHLTETQPWEGQSMPIMGGDEYGRSVGSVQGAGGGEPAPWER